MICVLIIIGGILGKLLGELPDNTRSGLSYGFIAFSVLPITLCMFGLKELNSAFPNFAQYLNKSNREALSKAIDERILRVILIAFLIVALQVCLAFYLLYFCSGLEFVILGILFGGIFASLVYGVYVCLSVRKLAEHFEEILSKEISKKRQKEYESSFNESD